LHDAFNLAVLPLVTAWTGAALYKQALNFSLAAFFAAYIFIDGVWIALQPDIVAAPRMLLVHHLVTAMLLWHPLTFAPHRHFVSWMTTVELNTLFLVLKRHVRHPLLELGFQASWIAIRVLWFPFLAVYLSFFAGGWPAGWQGTARHGLVAGTTSALACLQLIWTQNALRRPPAAAEAGPQTHAAAEDSKKKFL